MTDFYLQPLSLLALTQALLALFTVLYLVRIQNKNKASWMLVIGIGGLMLIWVSEMYNLSSLNNYDSIPGMLSPIVLFGFLNFAYEFQGNPYPKESKVAFWITLAAIIGFIIFHTGLLFTNAPVNETALIVQEIFITCMTLWASIVCFRKKSRIHTSPNPSLLTRLFSAPTRETHSLRAFGVLLFAIIPLNLRTIWDITHQSELWADSIQYLGFAVLLIAFVVIYINHSSEPTTFMVKLVGLSLATVLIVLGLTTLILYPDEELKKASRTGLAKIQSVRFEPVNQGGYRVASVPLKFDTNRGTKLNLEIESDTLVALDFSFPFYDSVWDSLYIDSNGLISFSAPYTSTRIQSFLEAQQPKIAPYYRALIPMSSQRSGVFFRSSEDRALITWYRVRERYDDRPDNENSFQIVLYPDGAIEFVYDTMEALPLYGFRGIYPGGAGVSYTPFFDEAPESVAPHALLPEGQTIQFIPAEEGNYVLSTAPGSFEESLGDDLQLSNGDAISVPLPFSFPFFEQRYDRVFVADNGVITMDRPIYSSNNAWFNPYDPLYTTLPIIAPVFDDLNPSQGGAVFYNKTPEKAVITWHDVRRFGSDQTYTVQLLLDHEGRIDFTYRHIDITDFGADLWGIYSGDGKSVDANKYLMSMESSTRNTGIGLVENFNEMAQRAFLEYRHDRMLPFFYLILGSSFFIIVVYPLFFRLSLVKPLAALLEGVHQVNEGNLDTQVPVRVNDEIGVLASNFNSMTSAIKEAEKQLRSYAEGLEGKVAERTIELQKALKHLTATQNQLIQAEKMASLGKLTAGVAHEIKNPLNFVNNFAQLTGELVDELEDELEDCPEHISELLSLIKINAGKINEHGKRADSIVHGMLSHSRNQSRSREHVDVNKLLDNFIRLASEDFKSKHPTFHVTVEKKLDPTVGTIKLVAGDMGRVFLNLINNALYAIHQKSLEMTSDYSGSVHVASRRGTEQVTIQVRDNGTGIAPDILDKIFEPFFTTKPPGSGNTGLGLSICYDIVSQGHGGNLSVESIENEGTTFTISLPINPIESIDQEIS